MTEFDDVVQTFLDGEAVEPAALDRALADADGRAYLIETLALRSLVKSENVKSEIPSIRPRRWTGRGLVAAAAMAMIAGLVGYGAGQRVSRNGDARTVAEVAPAPAPAPAYIIQLEPGVDWTERRGGN